MIIRPVAKILLSQKAAGSFFFVVDLSHFFPEQQDGKLYQELYATRVLLTIRKAKLGRFPSDHKLIDG